MGNIMGIKCWNHNHTRVQKHIFISDLRWTLRKIIHNWFTVPPMARRRPEKHRSPSNWRNKRRNEKSVPKNPNGTRLNKRVIIASQCRDGELIRRREAAIVNGWPSKLYVKCVCEPRRVERRCSTRNAKYNL